MAEFNADDKDRWYFGIMSREEANSILQAERDSGVFLVRDSTTIKGDFVLCVKEENKVAHYIINKIQTGGIVKFRIGDQEFSSLPALLNFYKTHYLDITSLIRPAQRPKYIAKYTFVKKDPDDLSFEKGEVLSLVRKDEEQWWTCCNSRNEMGLVPVPYIERYTGETTSTALSSNITAHSQPDANTNGREQPRQQFQRSLPAYAEVIKTRIPSAYDKSQLKLQVGDRVLVTAMHISGQWEGELHGVKGTFPFTHVKFLTDVEQEEQ